MASADTRLGELLIRNRSITALQLAQAQDRVTQTGGPLSYELVKLGAIEENEIVAALRERFTVPMVDLSEFQPETDIIRLIPRELVDRLRLVPITKIGKTLTIAMADPGDLDSIQDITFRTGLKVEVVVASERQILEFIERYYLSPKTFEDAMRELGIEEEIEIEGAQEDLSDKDLTDLAGDAPVIKLVNYVLLNAIKNRASDVHVEPFERQLRIRFRVDGVLYDVLKPPFKLRDAIVSRIKIMARLDISERRKPQDGRIKLKLGGVRSIDLRVGLTPTLHGEYVVIRLLDESRLQLDMTKLGFESSALELFRKELHAPNGLVLVTGPTGSGKTTTLYSALAEINQVGTNILTAEDPVEYNLFGVKQVPMNEATGLTFAVALRSFLRLDPDVILVGEVRDFETAEMAIKASLTGHLVLSTLHTNDAPSTIGRLLQMGVEPFQLATTIRMVVAQRLVRQLCERCRRPETVESQTLLDLGVAPEDVADFKVMRAVGCSECGQTGYHGRIAIYELMRLGGELRDAIVNGATTDMLRREAVRNGMKTLRMSALTKLRIGVTSLEEVQRVTGHD